MHNTITTRPAEKSWTYIQELKSGDRVKRWKLENFISEITFMGDAGIQHILAVGVEIDGRIFCYHLFSGERMTLPDVSTERPLDARGRSCNAFAVLRKDTRGKSKCWYVEDEDHHGYKSIPPDRTLPEMYRFGGSMQKYVRTEWAIDTAQNTFDLDPVDMLKIISPSEFKLRVGKNVLRGSKARDLISPKRHEKLTIYFSDKTATSVFYVHLL